MNIELRLHELINIWSTKVYSWMMHPGFDVQIDLMQ